MLCLFCASFVPLWCCHHLFHHLCNHLCHHLYHCVAIIQDADLVWMRDPIPILQAQVCKGTTSCRLLYHSVMRISPTVYVVYFYVLHYAISAAVSRENCITLVSLLSAADWDFFPQEQDITFMDDGARTPRFTPFFVNSGELCECNQAM